MTHAVKQDTINDSNTLVYAGIITIGDELLIGQVIDTNSAFISQQLNSIGIAVKYRITVGDVWNDIWHALDEASKQTPIVLITGGLGPTADDITKPLLCSYFGGKMVMDASALKNVEQIFQLLNKPVTERNKKQAEVPDVCTVIPNKRGTAPGMLFTKNGTIFISMPGVPHEMQGMITGFVLSYLQNQYDLPCIIHKTLLTAGIGEAVLADLIQPWETSLPTHMKLAYLPNYGMVRLRLSATAPHKEILEKEVTLEFEKLQSLVQDYLVTNQDEPIEKVIGKLLVERKETISTAESCTGGHIAALLTAIPGASAYYQGSIVSYSYDAKEKLLGVKHDTLLREGAVSEQVVLAMAKGALDQLQTTYAIAVSGIMGPDGGTTDKPVGTVWIAVGDQNAIIAKQLRFRFDRKRNIMLTANHALDLLRKFIVHHH